MSEVKDTTVTPPKTERKTGIQKIEFKVMKDKGNLLAFVSIKAVIEGVGIMLLGDMKILKSSKGDTFVGMPSKKVGEKYYDVYFPLSRESRNNLHKAILDAWATQANDAVEEEASGEAPPEWA